MICGVSGGKLQKQALKENFPRHSETITRHPEETQCPKDLCVSKEILARDVGEATSRTYRDTRKGTVVPLLQNDDLMCHPGGFPLCRENVTKCHIFERWRRVNGSEPSPGSEQIEHTKTECLYAKLCEREGNPRQLVSGSYQPGDSIPDWPDSEQTKSSPHPTPLPRRGNRHQFLSGGRGKQPYEQQRITDAGEGWQYRSCEESTVNRGILARDVGEATSRTYRDTRKGTVVPLLQNDDLMCHPGGFPLCRENVTKCHIFERWRRVNGSEPSPGSEQIEHTKTECLYAKLCEREGNPRQLVSGSYQPSDSIPDWSDSEHTRLS